MPTIANILGLRSKPAGASGNNPTRSVAPPDAFLQKPRNTPRGGGQAKVDAGAGDKILPQTLAFVRQRADTRLEHVQVVRLMGQ